MIEDSDDLRSDIEVWPAFADLFSALSLILLLLMIVNVRQAGEDGSGGGGIRTMRAELLRKLSVASDHGRLFEIDSGGLELRLSLSESMTFSSGASSASAFSTSSVQTIASIATILADTSVADFYSTIHVVGHTDQVPVSVRAGGLTDNWELSARRAVSIARLLLQSAQLNPCLLRATGAGPFHPLDTAAARTTRNLAANRRVSIVILPRSTGDDAIRNSCFTEGDGTLDRAR